MTPQTPRVWSLYTKAAHVWEMCWEGNKKRNRMLKFKHLYLNYATDAGLGSSPYVQKVEGNKITTKGEHEYILEGLSIEGWTLEEALKRADWVPPSELLKGRNIPGNLI